MFDDAALRERTLRVLGVLEPRHTPGGKPHNQQNHSGGGAVGLVKKAVKAIVASGKDLIDADGGVGLAREVVADAKKHEYRSGMMGPRGDEKLRQISERQGFDGKPQVVSKAELDEYLRENPGAVELHRGVKDGWDYEEMAKPGREDDDIELPAAEMNERFRSGNLRYGTGQFGNGTYASTMAAIAHRYAFGDDGDGRGDVMRMALRPDAKVVPYRQLIAEQKAFLDPHEWGSDVSLAYSDLGRYAAARGWDAMTVSGMRGSTEYLVFNRTALVVQEA